ncbi:response regulator transcription factor [Thiotrichales bacterium 19X7-9]|nr:response regulator transcription factor [Thiotrichales bacterium 19X7-9]
MDNSNHEIKQILIVDDDVGITESLKETLKARFNIESHILHDGKQVASVIQKYQFDAVLLDLMLPETDGIEVCRYIREITNIPIIMITASQEVTERVLAFDAGVDDFLVKPFSTLELFARIKAIYRRIDQSNSDLKDTIYSFDRWEFDTRTSLLMNENEEIQLSTADANLLVTFLENPKRILSRDFILSYSSNKTRDVYDRSIDVRVRILRQKIEEDTKHPKLILTKHGQGYLFNASVHKKMV